MIIGRENLRSIAHLVENTTCFRRHSEAEWMLRTYLDQQCRDNVTGVMNAKDLCCPTTSTSSLGLKTHTHPGPLWEGLATRPLLVGQLCLIRQLLLAMRSIGMRYRQLLLVRQLRLVGNFFGAHSFFIVHSDPDPVLSGSSFLSWQLACRSCR